jgi:hypothetical protein
MIIHRVHFQGSITIGIGKIHNKFNNYNLFLNQVLKPNPIAQLLKDFLATACTASW